MPFSWCCMKCLEVQCWNWLEVTSCHWFRLHDPSKRLCLFIQLELLSFREMSKPGILYGLIKGLLYIMMREVHIDSTLINWFPQLTSLMHLQELWSLDLDVAFWWKFIQRDCSLYPEHQGHSVSSAINGLNRGSWMTRRHDVRSGNGSESWQGLPP